jgi:hypothetical protein
MTIARNIHSVNSSFKRESLALGFSGIIGGDESIIVLPIPNSTDNGGLRLFPNYFYASHGVSNINQLFGGQAQAAPDSLHSRIVCKAI